VKKILIYTENYVPGGGNRYLVDIVNSIDSDIELYILSNKKGLFNHDFKRIKRNYHYQDIRVLTIPNIYICLERMNKILRIPLIFSVKFFSIFLKVYFKIFNISLLSRAITAIGPDIILSCNGGYPGGFSCLDLVYAAKKNNIPVILSVVSVPKKSSTTTSIVYKRIINHCDLVIVNASIIKETFVRDYHFPKNKFRIIHNCIDQGEIKQSNGNFKRYLQNIIDIEGYKVIGFVGRIETLKGVYVLLEAFEKVLADYKNVRLIMVGSGEIEKAKTFADNIRIKGSVIFIGHYEGNIYDVMDLFDIFVMPSLWEGLPYAVLEAMAIGKVIIASSIGGIPELIIDGETGILVKPSDSKDLADKIKCVLNDIDTNSYMSYNARKTIEKDFSSIKFASMISNILNENFK
jgi:glycosyltransferase involved in cell wall biosynthesis